MSVYFPTQSGGAVMEYLNRSGILTLTQYFRRLEWEKAIPGLTQAEFLVLSVVNRGQLKNPKQPGIYVSTLAEEMMISVSMASKLLKTLEEKDWILRTVDKNSRRNTFVSLTKAGKEMFSQADQAMDRLNKMVEEKMGKDSLEQLIRNLSQLFSCYEEALDQL